MPIPITDEALVRIECSGKQWSLNSQELSNLATVGVWLDNCQIDFLLQHIQQQNTSSKHNDISISNSFYAQFSNKCWQFSKDTGLDGPICLDIQSEDRHIHPLLLENHWMLLYMEKTTSSCTVFDSVLASKTEKQRKDELKVIQNIVLPQFLYNPSNKTEWSVQYFNNMPSQSDSESCGLYVLSAAEAIIKHGFLEIHEIKCPSETRKSWTREILRDHFTESGRSIIDDASESGNDVINLINHLARQIRTNMASKTTSD